MSIIHLMCVVLVPGPLRLPTIKIGLSGYKCDHIFARMAGSFRSHPVRKSKADPEVRPNLRTKRAVLGLENTSAVWTGGCTPNCNKSFFTASLSLPSFETICQGRHLIYTRKLRSECRWRRSNSDSIHDQPLQFHVSLMHNFLSL